MNNTIPAGIEALLGRILTQVTLSKNKDEIRFESIDGRVWLMNHFQDCCESVLVEDVTGELSDLVGVPILKAEESTRKATEKEAGDSGTWTFYLLATIKGYVTIRWLGTSNGYYGEEVDFQELLGVNRGDLVPDATDLLLNRYTTLEEDT